MISNNPSHSMNPHRFLERLPLFLITVLFALCSFLFPSIVHAAQIRLVWTPNSEPDLAGYKVYYGITHGGPYNSPGSPKIIIGNIPTYTLTGLTPGQKYYIVVTAYDQYNESIYSDEVSGFLTGPAEIVGTWSSGIWYYNLETSTWTKMFPSAPSGAIAVGDVTDDGKADVISCWPSGLWYQNGATLEWKKVCDTAPSDVAAGDITGDGRAEIIGTWSSGIWYYNLETSTWTKMYSSSSVPSGPIAVGGVTGDGRADVISCWPSGLWYQNGATLEWTKVYGGTNASHLAAGDITGD